MEETKSRSILLHFSDMGKEKTWERRANECKKKHRPKLKDWSRYQFGNNKRFDEYAKKCELNNPVCLTTQPRGQKMNELYFIDSIRAQDLSVELFVSLYYRMFQLLLIHFIEGNV